MTLDEMGIDEVLELRNQKDKFLKEGNMTELIKLKALYPNLFNENTEKEIQEILKFYEFFSTNRHFQSMLREEQKKKLITIDFASWKRGMLDDVLKQHVIIKYENIHSIARALVKEALLISFEQCDIKEITKVNEVLPFMGILVDDILTQFSGERRSGHLSRALFKLRSAAFNNEETEEISDHPQTIANSHDSILEQRLKTALQELLKKILFKFNKRMEHYHDLAFFLLLEVTDFLGLLTSIYEDKHLIIKQIESRID